MMQVGNCSEFVNDGEFTERESVFDKVAKAVLDFKSQTKLYRNTSQSVTYVLTTKNRQFI